MKTERQDRMKTDTLKRSEVLQASAKPAEPEELLTSAKPEVVLPIGRGSRKTACPSCGHRHSEVERTKGDQRYRKCLYCHKNFTTVEIIKPSENSSTNGTN